jgi:hypothetical protein
MKKVKAVKFRSAGKWHRRNILNDEKTICGIIIPQECRQADFIAKSVVADIDWVPPQRCRKCFMFNATDYVLDSVNARALSVSDLNRDCYQDSYIYQICAELVGKELIHVCCLNARTGANLYRVGNVDDCPERKIYHPHDMTKNRARSYMEVRRLINDDRFWLGNRCAVTGGA